MATVIPVSAAPPVAAEESIITVDVIDTPESKSSGGGKMGRSHKKYLHDKSSEEYKKRRERNNVAVRKSRDKSRMKTQETLNKINELKVENAKLEEKVSLLSKELSVLKDLFLSHAEELPDPSTTFGLFNSGATSKLGVQASGDSAGAKLLVANTIELSVDGENVATILTDDAGTIQMENAINALRGLGKQVILTESSGWHEVKLTFVFNYFSTLECT